MRPKSGRVEIGLPAPDFTLPDHKGEVFRLSDQRGKGAILLVFNRGFG
ncbi:MAG: redoxin domain-containing protein [Armatimonadetes bacterium]|nr:redoxin domain-containing protein [Armatimonadota bacterium]